MPLAARVESLATRRNLRILFGLGAIATLVLFFVRPTYPNYDTYYTMIWGDQLAHGQLPDYDVFRTPTPHPLATLFAAGASFLGPAADRFMVLITMASFLALVVLLFRFTRILLGPIVALVAVVVLFTRVDLDFYALRGVADIPFLAFIFGAATVELTRRRRGVAVFVLLGLAGLLRPEAWVFSGGYLLWLAWTTAPADRLRTFVRFAPLAAAAPVIWLLVDWAVTGDVLYSLTSTREVAGELGRQRGVIESVVLIPQYIGANETIGNLAVGGLGAILGVVLLRRRVLLPAALVAAGIATFLSIAAAGLAVIPRYLLIPSLVLNMCVAIALAGWSQAKEQRTRRLALGVAALALVLIVVRSPAMFSDLSKLNEQVSFVQVQHEELKSLLDDPRVLPLLDTCGPITTPTHSIVPVIRFETGLPKEAFEPSIAQRRPPDHGLLVIGKTFNFEPAAIRAATGTSDRSAVKPWSNSVLPGFNLVARTDRWRVYERCDSPRADGSRSAVPDARTRAGSS